MKSRISVSLKCDVGRVTACWSDVGMETPIDLSRTTQIPLSDGPGRINACLADLEALCPDDVQAVGRWLYGCLARETGITPGTEVLVDVEALAPSARRGTLLHRQMLSLIAFPWHLVADDRGFLSVLDIHFFPQLLHPARPIYEPFSDRLDVALALPTGCPESTAWRTEFESVIPDCRLHFDLSVPGLLDTMRYADVAYLPVCARELRSAVCSPLTFREPQPEGAVGFVSLDTAEIARALTTLSPRVLVLGCTGAPADALLHRAAFLAEVVPTVVVVPDPPTAPDVPGTSSGWGARRFLQYLLGQGTDVVEATRAMRSLVFDCRWQPLCFENRDQREEVPLFATESQRLESAVSWRYRLDRKEQTRAAVDEVTWSRESDLTHPGTVLLVHGEENSGLRPFNERLVCALSDAFDVVAVNAMWPGGSRPRFEDLAGTFLGAIGCPAETLATVSPVEALARNKSGLFDPGAPGRQLLFVYHNALRDPDLRARVPMDILQEYLEWWDQDFLPTLPRGGSAVLTLSFQGAGCDDWTTRLRQRLDGSEYFFNSSLLQLDRLSTVAPVPDLEQAIEEIKRAHRLRIDSDTISAMSDAVFEATGGVFLRSASVLDGLPLNWREWRRRSGELRLAESEETNEARRWSHPDQRRTRIFRGR